MKTSILIMTLFCIIAIGVGLSVAFLVSNPKTKPVLIPTPIPTPIPVPLSGIQQGPILIPSDATNGASAGSSVGLNSNGNIMVTGGYADNSAVGAAWVYVRSGTTWSQQTSKLIGSGASGVPFQGKSVAIASVEGKTILSGATLDGSNIGATWVFVQQSDQTWIQQGNKLVGSGYTGVSQQGGSVALSSDGNTALIGGSADNSDIGASWVFVRSNQSWTQQGNKLVGNGYSGNDIQQGWSVGLSIDGNTALIGGPYDNNFVGACWIFVRSNQTWTQQGTKLIGSNVIGQATMGSSVAISGDGNTAMIGGSADNSIAGAAWVFVRSNNNVWTQQGNKLIASDTIAGDNFGSSVSLDVDGNTAVIGATQANNGGQGKFYIFVRTNQTWNQVGGTKVATGIVGSAGFGYSISLSSDASTAAVGAPNDGLSQTGAVVMFT